MAVPGTRPKPAALKLLEGNRGHRPIKEPVKLAPVLPKTPRFLKGPALTKWKDVIKEMSTAPGWLTRVDDAVVAAFCECWGVMTTCNNFINGKGGAAQYLLWCQKNKYQPRHQLELRQARKDIRPLAAEIGFTPTSRGRVEPTGKVEEGEEDLD